ncbi:(4Fe-4S)-binding protein [Winogradskyella sp.]|uniref:(4Fe-4S)-binding protein n=1 Tax=Winogradskyella sp. TaxID=1883156 RepID=UPI003F6A9E24
MGKIKEYDNGEVTVGWEADKCIYSAKCVKNLPNVFQPNERPWIKIDASSTDALVETIKKCPSGALSYKMNNTKVDSAKSSEIKVEVLENGPLLVYGTLHVTDMNGNVETKKRTTAFCRCGASQNKPYCDGAHEQAEFRG